MKIQSEGKTSFATNKHDSLITLWMRDREPLRANEEEIILAQEQGAVMRSIGRGKELEAEFGIGERKGTLVLTNRRLVFACTDLKEVDLSESQALAPFGKIQLLYSEIEDLGGLPQRAPNVFIPITSINKVRGHKGELGRPSLEVDWSDGDGSHGVVFTEVLTGRRRRNLNDWEGIVKNLKAGRQKLQALPKPPSTGTLEGKIMHVLADMQEKGLFTVEEAVESEYEIELDPDEVQAACDRLKSQRFLTRVTDSNGEVFYRRISPLGEDNPSS